MVNPVELLAPFAVAVAVAAATTPLSAKIAHALGAVDRPDERKVNRRHDIPLLGGIAVALGFFTGLSTALIVTGFHEDFRGHVEGQLLGSMILLGLGLVDDRRALSARTKLPFQIIAAAVAIFYGFRIDHLTDPVSLNVWYFPEPLVWIVTGLWIVGITNAMNLMDGLDGLASGIGAIIGLTLTFIAWQADQVVGVFVGVAFLGAVLGFLPYNFPPARIFLGDTGALFIGFNLSLLALEGYRKLSVLTFVVPLLALAVPLMDTALSIYRRLRRGGPIMAPDRQHIHHRLLDSEGSHRSAVLSIWFLTACFCVIAVSFTNLEGTAAVVFLVLVIVLTLRLLRNLGFFEIHDQPRRDTGGDGS
ncbi:MAG: undecaprenyl-phosphate alpha-N-acetylglucosaminyl 1-phosphate transferase [Proteobacteria bacterium]|nr:MAG: undecaprenyl-phosphate alpha-N-acetylglucosaminyl 1-phosphate transferase [Pseudomonadota bacterium]